MEEVSNEAGKVGQMEEWRMVIQGRKALGDDGQGKDDWGQLGMENKECREVRK